MMGSKEQKKGYNIRLFMIGSHVDIISPIAVKNFYSELADSISKKSADPKWSGWHLFRKADGRMIALNIIQIIGVEELAEDEDSDDEEYEDEDDDA